MRQRLTASILFVVFLAAQLCPLEAQARDKKTTALQNAVNLIYTNPRLAEAQLRRLPGSSAKVFLAFLYMSHKVPTAHVGKRIDALMNAAIKNVPDGGSLGDLSSNIHYHYTDMKMLLNHLRFITDSDQGSVNIPNALIAQYPAEAFYALRPYWGSTRDGFISVELSKQEDVQKIPAVASYLNTLGEMFGDPGSNCTGTIRYHFYRKQSLAVMEASLAPQLFIEQSKHPDDEAELRQFERFLHTWANEELWNQQELKKLYRQSKSAELPLANFYRRRFNVTQSEAILRARAALTGISFAYMGEYAESSVDDTHASAVYQIFSADKLSLASMKKQLPKEALTKDQSAQALRLAILNNADVDVIEWLIKEGAPVSGGKEPPLFTTVLRPTIVTLLLKSGADANEINPIGKTALIQAAQYDAFETVKILLAAGADVKHAMVANDAQAAVDANATCDFNYTIGSRTPLMYAAAFSDLPVIMYLLSKGADKNAVDSKGDKAVKYLSWNTVLTETAKHSLIKTLSH